MQLTIQSWSHHNWFFFSLLSHIFLRFFKNVGFVPEKSISSAVHTGRTHLGLLTKQGHKSACYHQEDADHGHCITTAEITITAIKWARVTWSSFACFQEFVGVIALCFGNTAFSVCFNAVVLHGYFTTAVWVSRTIRFCLFAFAIIHAWCAATCVAFESISCDKKCNKGFKKR